MKTDVVERMAGKRKAYAGSASGLKALLYAMS
jgi:hypothetical protein